MRSKSDHPPRSDAGSEGMDHPADKTAEAMVDAADRLARDMDSLCDPPPTPFVYNPLVYARNAHHEYLRRYARGPKRVLFLGMNPGPFGMGQSGIPFGEIAAVTGWLGIHHGVTPPEVQHPKRPIDGFRCTRSEVSGRRLWQLFRDLEPDPDTFFSAHFVANYCPLLFLNERGANVTPDKLPRSFRQRMEAACDLHLQTIIRILQPVQLVAVGGFARRCAERVTAPMTQKPRIDSIIHPSPASPMANREWPDRPRQQLREAGVWP